MKHNSYNIENGIFLGFSAQNEAIIDTSKENVLFITPPRDDENKSPLLHSALTWRNSLFILDYNGDFYKKTSDFRKDTYSQDIYYFNIKDKNANFYWNPILEIDFKGKNELSDTRELANLLSQLYFSHLSLKNRKLFTEYLFPAKIIPAIILHLLYSFNKYNFTKPTLLDTLRYINKLHDYDNYSLSRYPHITEKEFMESPILDDDGNIQYDKYGRIIHYKNPLKEVYGEYITDFNEFSEALGVTVSSLDEIRETIKYKCDHGETISFEYELDGLPTGSPFYKLLVHPIVREYLLSIPDEYWGISLSAFNSILSFIDSCYSNQSVSYNNSSIKDILNKPNNHTFYFSPLPFYNKDGYLYNSLFIYYYIKNIYSLNLKHNYLFLLDKFESFLDIDYLKEIISWSYFYNTRFAFSTNSPNPSVSQNCGICVCTKSNPIFINQPFNPANNYNIDTIPFDYAKVISPYIEPYLIKKLTKANFNELLTKFNNN